MKSGSKGEIKVPPLDLRDLPTARAARRIKFIEQYCRVPKGKGAEKLMKLRPFQKEIIRGAFGSKIRTGLVSMPRANGKTALAAMLAVAELFAGQPSAEVLVVATDHRQAMLTMRMAKRIIQLDPQLADRAHIYQDRIEVPQTNSMLLPLPAEPDALHGHDPSLLIVDELHAVTEKVWEAVTSMTGKRPESLTLAISTPGSSPDSIMWKLVEHGRQGLDQSFYLKEFAAPDGCLTTDREAWKTANPAMSCRSPFLAVDGLESAQRTLSEPTFRQLRLGQWVTGTNVWLPFGAWDECLDHERHTDEKTRVVLAFDGSASGDSTALVGCTVGSSPHLFVEGLWEKPDNGRWRVPRGEVDAAIDMAFAKYDVVELAADPWGWRSEIETWASRHGEKRVLEWNTAHVGRMGPATDRMYQAVIERQVSHDGNPDLARHMSHCVAKRTSQGDVVSKDKKSSPRKIDAAVAAIVALDRAEWHAQQKTRKRGISFRS